jgi:hypothetical protein
MEYRNFSWADSISSILKKTERNLIKAQVSSVSMDSESRKSVIMPSSFADSFRRSSGLDNDDYEFPQFKNFVVERLNSNQKEIELLKRQINFKDDIELEYREDFNSAIAAVEKRSLNEIKRLESQQKYYITSDILKNSEESIKNYHLDRINQLELSFRDLISDFHKIPDEVSKDIEEKIENHCKKLFNRDEIKKIVNKDHEKITSNIMKRCEDIDKKHSEQSEALNKDICKIQLNLEKHVKIIKDSLASYDLKYSQKFNICEDRTQEIVLKHSHDFQMLLDQYKEMISLGSLQSEINIIKKQVAKVPNFSEYVKKSELSDLYDSIQQINQSNNTIRTEFKGYLDTKADLKALDDYVTRTELEKSEISYKNSLELIEQSQWNKSQLEKLKKQFNQSCKTCSEVYTKTLENQKSQDLLINKLVQLEQRVSLIEESDLEEESLSLEKVNKPITTSLMNLNQGSKESESTALHTLLSEKDFGSAEIEKFISKISENFIDKEISLATEITPIKPKKPTFVPLLNLPPQSIETPIDSRDDLNNAIILHSDFTNKSESPINFSLI